MKKRILSLVLAMSLISGMLTAVSVTAFAASSGACGESLIWTLDDSGTLTISGTGPMTNWTYYSPSPWSESSDIKKAVIESGVTNISDYAFYGCSGLKSVTIPNSVVSIGGLAFGGCSSLSVLTIPESVTSISSNAFPHCRSLTDIYVDSSSMSYCSEGGVVFNKDKTAIICHPAGKGGTYSIPNSVTSIGGLAFYGCSGLTSITIPSGVTSIGNSAFCGCVGLKSITLPNNVTSIGSYMFENCTGLTSITIPISVTSIGNSAFVGCDGLKDITISNSVTDIGNFAFENCTGLTSVTIPNSVVSIGGKAFWGCTGLTSITLSKSVTSIGFSAFEECNGLKDVYYSGTEDDWKKISIGSYNTGINNAEIHYNCYAPMEITSAVYADNTVKVKAVMADELVEKFGIVFIALYDDDGLAGFKKLEPDTDITHNR